MGGIGLGPPMEKIKNAAGQVQKYGVNEQYCFAPLFCTTTKKGSQKHGGPWVRPPRAPQGPPMGKIKNTAGYLYKYGVNEQYCFASLLHTTTLKGSQKHGGPWIRPPRAPPMLKMTGQFFCMISTNYVQRNVQQPLKVRFEPILKTFKFGKLWPSNVSYSSDLVLM